MSDDNKLTPKEKEFVRQYILNRNGAEAARKAGYKGKYPDRIAYQLLEKTRVRDAIAQNEKKVSEKFEITQEKIVQELAAIAFGHAGNVMDWHEGSMSFVPKKDMDENSMKFIESITQTDSQMGSSLSMKTLASQKAKALELLGRHIGMFKDGNKGTNTTDRGDVLKRVSVYLRKGAEKK